MARRKALTRRWYCAGCGKEHPWSREIEGDHAGRYWCAHSLRRAHRERRNDFPFERTPAGGFVSRRVCA